MKENYIRGEEKILRKNKFNSVYSLTAWHGVTEYTEVGERSKFCPTVEN